MAQLGGHSSLIVVTAIRPLKQASGHWKPDSGRRSHRQHRGGLRPYCRGVRGWYPVSNLRSTHSEERSLPQNATFTRRSFLALAAARTTFALGEEGVLPVTGTASPGLEPFDDLITSF